MMSRVMAGLALTLLASSPAAAQAGWKEYEYPKDGFAARYPGEPRLAEHAYDTRLGSSVTERVYSFDSGGVIYAVASPISQAPGLTAIRPSTKRRTG